MKSGEYGRRTASEVEFDRALGSAIRRRRQVMGMSQSDLGGAIDQTFQQVQKYELGTNSVKVCRLMRIAEALQTTPATLVSDASSNFGAPEADRHLGTLVADFLSAPPSLQKAVRGLLRSAKVLS